MKYAGGFFIFLVAFVAVGIAMHFGLYGQAGLFVWSLQEDPVTGEAVPGRTVLAEVEEVEVAAAAAAEPGAKSGAAGETNSAAETNAAAGEAEELESAPAPEPTSSGEKTDASGVIPLFDGKTLGSWEKTRFGGEGDVFVDEEGNLEFGFGAVISGVNWKGEPPATSNYEISLEAMKLDGNDFFLALTFPVKDSHATFVVGGWGGGVVGISSVDDLNASENETMNIEGFEKDVWHKIRVRVTDDKLQAWIDDEEKVDLDLEGRKISLLPGDIELSVPIGIAAYQTRAQYRNIEWRNLKEEK